MKIFSSYNPQRIALYVKALFRGRLYIQGIGAFEFDMGKILPPKVCDKTYFNVMAEVNREVRELRAEFA